MIHIEHKLRLIYTARGTYMAMIAGNLIDHKASKWRTEERNMSRGSDMSK